MKIIEKFAIFNKSDIDKNWSADYHINKKEGKNPYIKVENIFIEVNTNKSIPKNAVYLTPTQALKYNKLSVQINKLKELQNKIIEK